MSRLGKRYLFRSTGAVYEVVATDTGDGSVTLLHTTKNFTVRFPETVLGKILEEVA